jgi:transposase
MAQRTTGNRRWRAPDELWNRVEPLLPKYRPGKHGGRPRVDRRRISDGILYVLRTGCQWNAAPKEFGSSSTLHRSFREWTDQGVFFRLWKEALREYDELEGIDWGWQSLDGSMTKAPLGGGKPAPTPRIRANPEPNVPFLRMEAAFLWPWPWPCRAPTRMTSGSSSPR